jgi:tetratricopeptide (TPR) repeat protein
MAFYQQQRFGESLQAFRELAMQDPEFPLLARRLVEAETAVEKQRSEHLSEQNRREVARLVQSAATFLEKEQYAEAETVLQQALRMDPSHPQAKTYLALAHAQTSRRYDPQAAEIHYETGIMEYASGKVDDAVREWRVALRLNPKHERAQIALAKTQRQLAYDRETP